MASSQIPSRPHAFSPKSGRQPFEYEGGDELGPAPALDLSPGDAESEAKRMLYEKTHPLHDAVMQGGHINHAFAVKRYQSLMRRAWDPAARTIPVQPARIIGDDGNAHMQSLRTVSGLERLPHEGLPTAIGASRSNLVSEISTAKSLVKAGKQATTPGTASATANKPVRPPELPRLARDALIERHAALAEDEVVSRPEKIRSALSQLPTGMRTHSLGLMATIPHQQNPSDWAAIGQTVLERKSWSDTDQYVHRYILGFEGLSYDRYGESMAGIQTKLLKYDPNDNYFELLNAYRVALGKAPIASGTDVRNLTLQDLLDAQRVYLAKALHPKPHRQSTDDWVQNVPLNNNFLDQFGSPDIAAQIADTVYQHGSKDGSGLLQIAVNEVLATLSADQLTRLGLPDRIVEDKVIGSESQKALQALGNNSTLGPLLLREIREQRVIYTHRLDSREEQGYTGATINRIWSIRRH
ncbi:MAG: hypothetical protein WEC00_01665 [Dongiaceae bacterium]